MPSVAAIRLAGKRECSDERNNKYTRARGQLGQWKEGEKRSSMRASRQRTGQRLTRVREAKYSCAAALDVQLGEEKRDNDSRPPNLVLEE
eukprot:IDg16701t1